MNRHLWRCKARQQIPAVNSVIENQSMERTQIRNSIHDDIIANTPEHSIANNGFSISTTNDPPVNTDDESWNSHEERSDYVSCYCGKKCKGIRGLQAHKRSCKVIDIPDIKALLTDPVDCDLDNEDLSSNESVLDDYCYDKMCLQPGIKLPRNEQEWSNANDYFKNNMRHIIDHRDVNNCIIDLQNSIYDYFRNNYGIYDKNINDKLYEKYSNHSNRKLK